MQFVAFLYLMAFQQPMLDNEFVTVHMATDQPQSKSELHRHALDRVMIYLDDGKLRIENVNGPVENQSWKPGQVAWSPAGGDHTSENIGDQVLRIVEVELTPTAPSAKAFVVSPFYPVTEDPKHYRLEFENSKVRVIHGKYNLHESGIAHKHASRRVVVYLIGDQMDITTEDGKRHVMQPPAGAVWWPANSGAHRDVARESPIEMVVVELK